ncbi:MAG TPA: RlmI/RlmK family 23S rRNA methyltransferase [Cytophagales bacterium]|nr:RlmI/RlmK family 23S rRNA methyltransferase [Cytophagales bacterium]
MPRIILKSGKDRPLHRFHLWVFSGAIKNIEGEPKDGDWVEVFDNQEHFLAAGHFNNGSIKVRVLSFQKETPDESFWQKRIQSAVNHRKSLGFFDDPNTNVFRMVHGEGDLLPGLIIDYYAGVCVLQAHSVGMFRNRHLIVEALKNVFNDDLMAIYDKSDHVLNVREKPGFEGGFLWGECEKVKVREYGNTFEIDFISGQKTGFFVDQRENRNLLTKYAQGKYVLNMFCYTGGFSVFAAQAGAKEVTSVDVSANAIAQCRHNMKMNGFTGDSYQCLDLDAFEYLNNLDPNYDLIILDPPAFAKRRSALNNALKGYRKINEKAIGQIKPGGILFTFSCSQVVDKDAFRKSIFTAAANTGRQVRILHQLSQPADHPVNIYHPEGEYLKGLVLQVG